VRVEGGGASLRGAEVRGVHAVPLDEGLAHRLRGGEGAPPGNLGEREVGRDQQPGGNFQSDPADGTPRRLAEMVAEDPVELSDADAGPGCQRGRT
jgi:hypothetical protein